MRPSLWIALLALAAPLVGSENPELTPQWAWRDPEMAISPPPETVGQQMGVVDTIGQLPMGYTLDGTTKVFTLIAQPVETVFTDGDTSYWDIIPEENRWDGPAMQTTSGTVKAWGFNGQVPGPTIEATEGDRIRIIVKNEIPEPTSVHWHGIELPNAMDGAAGVTQPPIMPGESHTYEFTLYQSGTFMYHTGFNVMKQDGYGLSGLIVIHAKNPPKKIDRDFAILLQEWAYVPGNETPNLASMMFSWFTFNGRVAPSIPVLTVKQGERVRIRFGNLSMNSHPIHLHDPRIGAVARGNDQHCTGSNARCRVCRMESRHLAPPLPQIAPHHQSPRRRPDGNLDQWRDVYLSLCHSQ
jgi:manganese oxidase